MIRAKGKAIEETMTGNFTYNYSDIKGQKPRNARSKLRNLTLDLLSGIYRNTIGWDNYLKIPRVQFLYIHHVFSDEEDEFRRLLDALSKNHQFVSYTEAWNRIRSGEIDKPYISFSSDDGLKNNLRAADILNEFGASACFFICPSVIGEKSFEKLSEFSSSRLHFPPVEFLDWDDVDQLKKTGHEIGSHTMSHINVAETPDAALKQEIGESYNVIKRYCGEINHFAYPYGRYFHFSEAGRKVVFDSGFISCASAERGCHIKKPGGISDIRDLLIRRDHVILDWPLDHIFYFLVRNAMKANLHHNTFPTYAHRSSDQ